MNLCYPLVFECISRVYVTCKVNKCCQINGFHYYYVVNSYTLYDKMYTFNHICTFICDAPFRKQIVFQSERSFNIIINLKKKAHIYHLWQSYSTQLVLISFLTYHFCDLSLFVWSRIVPIPISLVPIFRFFLLSIRVLCLALCRFVSFVHKWNLIISILLPSSWT